MTTELLALDGEPLAGRLQQLKAAAARAERESHRPPVRRRPQWRDPSDVERESVRVYAAVGPLIDRYPRDPGVLVTLLLNHVVLAAGEAMFIDAGIIHAYTSGFGVEVMASSDNVLRAGLTPKHVDIPELLAITNFTPVPPPLWAPRPLADSKGYVFSPPVEEFELALVTPRGEPVADQTEGPRIALCLDGAIEAETAADRQQLRRGEAVFVPAAEGPVTVSGRGRAAIARPPG